jgi:hypothetical protein
MSPVRRLVAALNGIVGVLFGASSIAALAMLPDAADEYAQEPEDLWLASAWAVYWALGSATAIVNFIALGRSSPVSVRRPYVLHGLNGTFHVLTIALATAWVYALVTDPWLRPGVDVIAIVPALVTCMGHILAQFVREQPRSGVVVRND